MTEDDRWRDSDPPPGGPSTPPDLRFNPLSTGLGVFAAVAIPAVVVGYTRPGGVNGTIIVLGILGGVIVGLLVGLWVAHRGGWVWRGPRL